MAKNKTNVGAFGVEDLMKDSQEKVEKINSSEPTQVISEPTSKRRIIKRETKSKRINLLVRPSVYEEIVKIAEAQEVSLNELINSYMEEIIKK